MFAHGTSSFLRAHGQLGYKGAENEPSEDGMTKFGNVAADQLRSYIERIEKLEQEKADIAEAARQVFAEAKGNGFDTKAMRQIMKLRKMESHEREEQEYMLDLYKRALGMALDADGEELAA
jgi:uncharacterized protein (UPF0335 family)